MAYTDTISLASAKDYLGVDDTSRDTEITRMIKSALQYLEKRTNVLMDVRDKTYNLIDGCVRVYDSPINTLDVNLDATVTRENKGLYSIYKDTDIEAKTITLNVGSNTVDSDLLEAAYMLIEHYFNEGDKNIAPQSIENIIAVNKRFIL